MFLVLWWYPFWGSRRCKWLETRMMYTMYTRRGGWDIDDVFFKVFSSINLEELNDDNYLSLIHSLQLRRQLRSHKEFNHGIFSCLFIIYASRKLNMDSRILAWDVIYEMNTLVDDSVIRKVF